MSKYANAGALRTPVRFMRVTRETDSEGYPVETRENVFGGDQCVYCEWVNAHGTETFAAMQLELKEPATLTMRYSPLIDETLLVYKDSEYRAAEQAGDEQTVVAALERACYEIISLDNVEEQNTWMEIKVQRKVAAR